MDELKKVCKRIPSLYIATSTYGCSDGTFKELKNLKGTIQICFKKNYYNIPIQIWIMDTHPINAPICYVVPTPEMYIKASRHVDESGKIYLPYLHEWNSKKSDLITLIEIMKKVFSQTPPLYSKATNSSSSTSADNTANQYNSYGSTPYPMYSPQSTPPSPYPSTAYPQYPNMPVPGTSSGASSSGSATPSASVTPYPPYPMSGTSTITDEHIRDSLISAIEDKLRRKMRDLFLQNDAEMDTLNRTKQELLDGQQKLDGIVTRLRAEKVQLEQNLSVIEKKSDELSQMVDRVTEMGDLNLEDAIVATTPLYQQMLDIHAEESAIEDTIYYLDEGLRRGVIDLDTFLKQVRSLSYQQFVLRALLKKCRKIAGLSSI